MEVNHFVIYIDPNGEEHNALVTDVNQLHPDFVSISYMDASGRHEVYDIPHMSHPSKQEPNPNLPTFHLHCYREVSEKQTPIPADHPIFDHPFEPKTKDSDGRVIAKPRPLYDAVVRAHVDSRLPSAEDLDADAEEKAIQEAAKGKVRVVKGSKAE